MNYFKLSLCLFSFSAIISCSDSTDDAIEENQPSLKLSVEKDEKNILEMLEFNLSYHNDRYTIGTYIADNFDSIIFKTSEGNVTKKIANETDSPKTITFKWGHHFYTPGQKTVSLIGYKNNKIVLEDKHTLNVTNNKDFLNTNWNQFKVSEFHTGYINLGTTNILTLFNSTKNEIPSVRLSNTWENLNPKNIEYESISGENNFKYLSNYITELYGDPSYTIENNPTIKSIYLEKFKYSILDNNPVKIWITNKNKIALIKEDKNYYIIAEENQ